MNRRSFARTIFSSILALPCFAFLAKSAPEPKINWEWLRRRLAWREKQWREEEKQFEKLFARKTFYIPYGNDKFTRIAVTSKVPDEFLADFPAIEAYVNQRLPFMMPISEA